jgi:hypothetical protein
MSTSVATPTASPVTAAQVHHSWVQILLQILKLSAAVAPLALAPVLDKQDETLASTEAGLASQVLGGIGAQ